MQIMVILIGILFNFVIHIYVSSSSFVINFPKLTALDSELYFVKIIHQLKSLPVGWGAFATIGILVTDFLQLNKSELNGYERL